MVKENWKKVHEDFKWSYKQEYWEEKIFTYQEVKSWIEKGLTPDDYLFAYYLKKDGYQPTDLNKNNLEELRKKCAWQDIHKDFSFGKREEWESQGFNYQETKSLIELNFLPSDSQLAKKWKNSGFNLEEVENWIKSSLNPHEINFASHLKQNNYQSPQLITDELFKLRKEFYHSPAQEYLDKNYPWKERKNLQELKLHNLNLTGDLDLEGFDKLKKIYLTGNPNLGEIKGKTSGTILIYQNPQEWLKYQYANKEQTEKIDLEKIDFEQPNELIIDDFPNLKRIEKGWSDNYNINKLTISNCPQLERINIRYLENNQQLILNDLPNLKELDCSNNKLTKIKLPKREKLAELCLSNNNFSKQDLSFLSSLANLERLNLANNNFYGSLKSLQNMSKLEKLNISDTDIDSGLEYLPDSLKEFYCSADKRKEAKCQVLYNLFANDQGAVENNYGWIKNFPQKLQDYKQWIKLNFTEEEIKQWIKAGFILGDYESANNFKQVQSNIPVKEIIQKESWQDIHSDFNYQIRKNWERKDFDKEETQKWTNAGAKLNDYEFVAWLRDIKKETPEWIANYKENYQFLSEKFKEYGLCSECNQLNTGRQWCQACNSKRFEKNFSNWTSNNSQIDKFIQKYQLAATDADKFLEWIPYEQFTDIESKQDKLRSLIGEENEKIHRIEQGKITKENRSKANRLKKKVSKLEEQINRLELSRFLDIKYLAEGGFSKVYKASWNKGNIRHWDSKNKQWNRERNYCHCYEEKCEWYKMVVLKSLNNSQDIEDSFLQEIANHKIIDDWFNNIVPCYGLSQDPAGNYLMVMDYVEGGNLREYLKNKKIGFKNKLFRLVNISQGLKDIHNKGLIYRDLHSGNVLNSDIRSFITDLGLSKPANESSEKEKVYGVLPYIAPEVLRDRKYTSMTDIYSFGILACEILSELPPYHEHAHDINLTIKIFRGLRPQFQIKIPSLLEDLIQKCWDADPNKRPTASELSKILGNWLDEVEDKKNTEFTQQYKKAEEEQACQMLSKLYQHLKGRIKEVNLENSEEVKKELYEEFSRQHKLRKEKKQSKKAFDKLLVYKSVYKTHPSAIYTSRLLEFKDLPEPQNSREINDEFYKSKVSEDLGSIQDTSGELISDEQLENNPDWQNIHSSFTSELIQSWQNLNFTYLQTQEWINIGLTPQDYEFAHFLKNIKGQTPEQTLDYSNLENLKQDFQIYQQIAQVQVNPLNPLAKPFYPFGFKK